MVESQLRWFGHVEIRLVDFIVRRANQIEVSQIVRGMRKPKKIIRETIKKDL